MPKISQLPTLETITSGSIIPVVDNSITQKLSVGKLFEFLSGALDQTFATEIELMLSASSLVTTSSFNSFSSSVNNTTQSLNNSTSSLNTFSASVIATGSIINTFSSSVNTTTASLNSFSASVNSKTGSYATTGSNVFSGNQTISDSLIVSEIVSTTAPAEGDIASAGETGITYLTGDLTKWAIFREDAFTIGVWTDVVAGWAVTDNNGFTDIIAGRGSFGAASFQTTVNNWPAPASGRTYVFTSPDYQPESANPLEIAIGNNDWVFGVGGDLDVPGNINGAPNLAITGSNTFVGNQTITGSLNVSGSIIPNTGVGTYTSSFSLGSATNAWKELWVSNGSVNFVDPISGNTASIALNENNVISVQQIESIGNLNVTGSLGAKFLQLDGSWASGGEGDIQDGGMISFAPAHRIYNHNSNALTFHSHYPINFYITKLYDENAKFNFTGSVKIWGDRAIAGAGTINPSDTALEVIGNTELSGSLLLSGSEYISGSLSISGSLNIEGSGSLNGDNIVASNTIMKIQTISSASYAALNPPVSGTLYIII
jgi:hypothetical protein